MFLGFSSFSLASALLAARQILEQFVALADLGVVYEVVQGFVADHRSPVFALEPARDDFRGPSFLYLNDDRLSERWVVHLDMWVTLCPPTFGDERRVVGQVYTSSGNLGGLLCELSGNCADVYPKPSTALPH